MADRGTATAVEDLIHAKTASRIRSYFEARDDWNLSRSLKNLIEQAIRDYEHRAVLELVQNAHDAQPVGCRDGRILIRLDHDEGKYGALIVANTGNPFTSSNFDAICDVAQSDKRPDEGIGNKGIGFKSVLQLCRIPEVYSTISADSSTFDGYCFRFATEEDLLAAVDGDVARAADLTNDVFHLCLPIPVTTVPESVASLREAGYVSVIRLPLKSEAAREEAAHEIRALEDAPPTLLFLRRICSLIVEECNSGELVRRVHDRRELSTVSLDARSTVTKIVLGADEGFLIAERIVDGAEFRAAIDSSVAADRISAGWADWEGEVRVGLALSSGEPLAQGRLYTFLPMGEQAPAPLLAHVNAPFFAKLARVSFEESVPLNDFLLDEIAALCAALVLGARDGAVELHPCGIADLLAWVPASLERLIGAFERRHQPLESALVLPLRGPDSWGSFTDTRAWDDEDKAILTAQALGHSASAKLLHESIDAARVERLDEVGEALIDRSLHPTDAEVATWAEALASSAARKKRFAPRWWEDFYDELAGAIADRASLQGRRLLIDDDLGLQHCAVPGQAQGPVPFFSPKADDAATEDGDEDLRIPRTLKSRIVFVNQKLQWTQRTGAASARRPGRRMLAQESAGLVHDYRASELFGVLDRALQDRPSGPRCRDALRWAYRFVQAREDPPWSDIQDVAFKIPTVNGNWISTSEAVFSREWGSEEDHLLGEFISKASGISDDLDSLSSSLVAAPDDWPFDIENQDSFREFLSRLGVRSGLWPRPMQRRLLSADGCRFEDLTAPSRLPMPEGVLKQWRLALARSRPWGLRPQTNYRANGPMYLLPGQAEHDHFDDASRRLYAQLIIRGLDQWDDAMLNVAIRRYNDAQDRFSWPTPVHAFLEEADWVPMARSRERRDWYFVRAADAWSHGFGDDSDPTFAPLVPHALRRLAELRPRTRQRLERLGVRSWDNPSTAPDRVRLLAQLLRDGEVGDAAAARFRKAYEQAWGDVVEHGLTNPFADEADPWIVATIRGQLSAVPLTSGDDNDPIYIQDVQSAQAIRLIEQRPVPLLRMRARGGDSVAEMIAFVAGARVRRVSEAEITVRVDGQGFAPSGVGESLIEGRRWLADLVTLLTELRTGQFVQPGADAIQRTRETLKRTRLVLAERIEIQMDGATVEGSDRALALADDHHPTVVVARTAGGDESSLLQAAAPAIAELIGYPGLADTIRVSLIDLAALGAFDSGGPTTAALAQVIGEPETRVRELTAQEGEPLVELARTLTPLLATVNVALAAELWATIDSFADTDAIVEWLRARVAPSVDVSQLLAVAVMGDLDAARRSLAIELPDLNAAIDLLGPPFEQLRNPDGVEDAFRYFVQRHRTQILEALRSRYLAAYQAFDPLEEYVARRDLTSLLVDPDWVDHYVEVDDAVIRERVAEWLAEVDAELDEAGDSRFPAIDELRLANRAALHEVVAKALLLIRAWERQRGDEHSDLPGEPGVVVDLASGAGQLDFEPLTPQRAVAWLVHTGVWPEEMPRSLDASEVGVPEDELDEAKQRREEEERQRREAKRQISIDGELVNAEEANYAAIVDTIRDGLTPDLLATPPKVIDLPPMAPAGDRGSRRRSGGITAARRPGLSDVQMGAVGLAGEVVALEWLKANYADATDASWRSGYRNLVLGGNEGDDGLGYDLEVVERRRRLLFEVKASMNDSCEFDLTEGEIRAAQALRRGDKYFILYVTHVLISDQRAIHLLPNPLGTEGLGRYRTVGSGLRLRFTLE